MTKPINEIEGVKCTDGELRDLNEWLADRKGKVFFDWLAARSQASHDYASKPIGANAITDIIASQRWLAEENAFDKTRNFANMIKQIVAELQPES